MVPPQHILDNIETLGCEQYPINEKMENLTELYLENNIVTEKYWGDALHIAIATVIPVDVLVSWNFKHIVNLDKIKRFNAVNSSEGYSVLEIRTPKELIKYE